MTGADFDPARMLAAAAVEAAERVTILVASLPDIVRSKEAANREKDRAALPRLPRLRRLRDRLR